MVRTARSAPLFRRRRLPTPQAPPKQTVSPHLPPVSLSWRKSSKSNVMVWDFSGTTAVAVPYTPESSAHAARLEGIITRLALRAKQGKQVGPSTTAGRFEATMFSPAVTVATASPSPSFPLRPTLLPPCRCNRAFGPKLPRRLSWHAPQEAASGGRARCAERPFLFSLFTLSLLNSFACEPQFVSRWIPFYRA